MNFNKGFSFFIESKGNISQPEQHRLGNKNKGKIVYLIEEDNENLGFFAMYRRWIEYLYFAHICGYVPVINAGEHFAYRSVGGKKRTNNAFEYYFEQPAGISIEEAYKSNRVIFSEVRHRQMVELVLLGKYDCYFYNKRYLHMMSDIVRRYIKFNRTTWNYITDGIDRLGIKRNRVLGIHVRGTDFRKKFNDHPVFVSEQDVFDKIESVIPKYGYDKIFLATDDASILNNFITRYRDLVCNYTDVIRSDSMQSVIFQKNNRRNNQQLLGLEVIRDMYTLSQCEGFICGMSQVAVCAQMNKLARKEIYKDIEVIDHGIYKNNRNFHRYQI